MTSTLDKCKPIFAIKRGSTREMVIHGWAGFSYVAKQKLHKEMLAGTELNSQIIARSLLKPWQFWATGFAVGEATPELALGVASQSAQDHQLTALKTLQQHAHVDPQLLKCPASMPMDRSSSERLRREGTPKNRQFHPCAGKHSFALASCLKHNWSTEDYLDPQHPLQQKLRQLLGNILNCPSDSIVWETDSCGLPSARLSMDQHLTLWHELASSQKSEAVLIRKLWRQYPEYIGGHGRLDTEIVIASKHCVMSKEGADGLLVVQDTTSESFQGSLVKIASGYQSTYMALATLAVLKKYEFRLSESMKALKSYLEARAEPGREWISHDQSFEILL